jgi:hypothetical protein
MTARKKQETRRRIRELEGILSADWSDPRRVTGLARTAIQFYLDDQRKQLAAAQTGSPPTVVGGKSQ